MLKSPFLLGDEDVFYMISSSLAGGIAFGIEERAICGFDGSFRVQGGAVWCYTAVSGKTLISGGVELFARFVAISPRLNCDLGTEIFWAVMRKRFPCR